MRSVPFVGSLGREGWRWRILGVSVVWVANGGRRSRPRALKTRNDANHAGGYTPSVTLRARPRRRAESIGGQHERFLDGSVVDWRSLLVGCRLAPAGSHLHEGEDRIVPWCARRNGVVRSHYLD